MRFAVLGTSEFAKVCAEAILESEAELAAIVSLKPALLPNNPFKLQGFAEHREVPYFEVEDINNQSSLRLLHDLEVDYLFVSWPRILKRAAISTARKLCIGTHPTALPANRGRHPLHWTIALGLKESALSFFAIDEGVDSGNILLQLPFAVSDCDDINTLSAKVNALGKSGLLELCAMLKVKPDYKGLPQDETKATYWRKRTPVDVLLDPTQSADTTMRLVRSFTIPYPCAKLVYGNEIAKISSAQICTHPQSANLKCGTIVERSSRSLLLKVADATLLLESPEEFPAIFAVAGSVEPPSIYLTQYGNTLLAKLAN